jgi:hypothetical protein
MYCFLMRIILVKDLIYYIGGLIFKKGSNLLHRGSNLLHRGSDFVKRGVFLLKIKNIFCLFYLKFEFIIEINLKNFYVHGNLNLNSEKF